MLVSSHGTASYVHVIMYSYLYSVLLMSIEALYYVQWMRTSPGKLRDIARGRSWMVLSRRRLLGPDDPVHHTVVCG